MLIEIDDDVVDKVVAESLLNTYHSVQENSCGIPIFSMDKEEENKKVGKLLRSIERVHDWYNATPLKQRLKSEKALEEISSISQEIGLYESK